MKIGINGNFLQCFYIVFLFFVDLFCIIFRWFKLRLTLFAKDNGQNIEIPGLSDKSRVLKVLDQKTM